RRRPVPLSRCRVVQAGAVGVPPGLRGGWAQEDRQLLADRAPRSAIARRRGSVRVPVDVESVLPEQVVLFDVRQDLRRPRMSHEALGRRGEFAFPRRRELAHRVMVVVQSEPQLFEVVAALHAVGRLADLLDRGKEQANEDRDNGDYDQQFDQRERHTTSGVGHLHRETSATEVMRGTNYFVSRNGSNSLGPGFTVTRSGLSATLL